MRGHRTLQAILLLSFWAPLSGNADDSLATARDTHELINAVLWTQTSVEHHGLTRQIYATAKVALEEALADPGWTAALEQEDTDFADLPPAIILDIDETVLDNSRLFGEIIQQRVDHLENRWTGWIARGGATPLPGALEFLTFARERGVKVFFVTNRNVRGEEATLRNLNDIGIPVGKEDLLMAAENGWTTNKTARRQAVAEHHRILLLLGDDIGDFTAPRSKSVAGRQAAVSSHDDRWGRQWFVFPNPMHGSWQRANLSRPKSDAEALEQLRAAVRGFIDE